jgi:hypothetical protein
LSAMDIPQVKPDVSRRADFTDRAMIGGNES